MRPFGPARLASLSRGAGALAVAVGCLVLIGWLLDTTTLKSVAPGLASMKPNAAVAFVLAGLALWLSQTDALGHRGQRLMAWACAAAATLIGLLSLFEYVFGQSLGIDQLLFRDAVNAGGTSDPGRMAPATATNFVLLGAALLLLPPSARRPAWPAQALATTAFFASLLAAVGYAYGTRELPAFTSATQMALHTALTFVVLSAGVLLARPQRGPVALLTRDSAGGSLARRLLPAAVLVPLALGLLRNEAQDAGLYGTKVGLSIFAMSNVIVFTALVYLTARSLDRTDRERRRAEEEIRTLNAELEQRVRLRTAELEAANEELESFSYSVSHDLRAPLRAMDGFSHILLDEHAAELGGEGRHYLGMVRHGAQEMGTLVDDLLALSRLGRQPLKRQQVEPAAAVRRALADLRAEQEGREVSIEIDDLPACRADPGLLKQVYANLLGNALKFTRGREQAAIKVGWAQADEGRGRAYFVKDNGVGFDMDYAGKLFGAFQRLHSSEEYDGTGVGLATVQRIVHRHGGEVWAESEPGRGATFYFTLGGMNSERGND